MAAIIMARNILPPYAALYNHQKKLQVIPTSDLILFYRQQKMPYSPHITYKITGRGLGAAPDHHRRDRACLWDSQAAFKLDQLDSELGPSHRYGHAAYRATAEGVRP